MAVALPDAAFALASRPMAVELTLAPPASVAALAPPIEKADAGCPFRALLKKAGVTVEISRA